jgi:two-component system sensor histidine kinase YesM
MNTSESLVTLSREFEHVNSYLELQKERFGDKLNVKFNIEENALDVKVPKIIIQPFVENYFKYAFKKTNSETELLQISAVNRFGFVEICIKDNGPGIELGKLEEINKKIQNAATDFQTGDTQIGIINVAARLKLYFHDEADLKLESVEGNGLSVIILIPYEMKGDNYESNHN